MAGGKAAGLNERRMNERLYGSGVNRDGHGAGDSGTLRRQDQRADGQAGADARKSVRVRVGLRDAFGVYMHDIAFEKNRRVRASGRSPRGWRDR